MTPSEWCLSRQTEYILAYREECKIIGAEEYEACEEQCYQNEATATDQIVIDACVEQCD